MIIKIFQSIILLLNNEYFFIIFIVINVWKVFNLVPTYCILINFKMMTRIGAHQPANSEFQPEYA